MELSFNLTESCWHIELDHFLCCFSVLDSPLTGNGYPGDQQSLRSRRVSSRGSNQNYPQFNWSSTAAQEDEESNSGQPRDIRGTPLPMALKRAVRYETCF